MGTALEDLAGVDVGDTLFVGDPWRGTDTSVNGVRLKELFQKYTDWKGSYLCWRPGGGEGGRVGYLTWNVTSSR